jgi:hypothetical protein
MGLPYYNRRCRIELSYACVFLSGPDVAFNGGAHPATPFRRTTMRISCSILQPVSVTDYKRFRFGRWEYVCTHCRSLPAR